MENDNPKIHLCKDCKSVFKIISFCKHGTYYYSPKLYQCPQCNEYDIVPIDQQEFNEHTGVWFRAKRKIGKRIIKFSMKV